jgi:hypothetical protein
MNEIATLWLEAAKVLAVNPNAIINCPACKIGKLLIKDEPFGKDQIDRYLICDACGKYETITMSKPKF